MHMACNHGSKAAHGCICRNEAKEGFGCSSSVPSDMFIKTSVADDINYASLITQFGSVCHENGFDKEYRKCRSLRNHGHELLLDSNPASNGNVCPFPSGQPRFPEVPTKVGFLSSNMNSTKETPSFEFFVMSEEGINLYVDLNSSPSEWITTLKDEVFIDHNSNLGSLSHHSRCVSDASQHINPLPSKNVQMNLHVNKVEENSGCTNSSLSSVVSANCQDEVYRQEAKVASSGSYILTSSSNPARISGLEKNQAVSSPCIASFKEKISMLENHEDVSVRTLQSNVSVRDVSSKSNGEAVMHADVANNIELIEYQSLKLGNGGYDNADNLALSNCEENNMRKSVQSLGNTNLADVSIAKNNIDIDVMKLERDCKCDTMECSSHHEPSSSCQFCGQSSMNTLENLCCHQLCDRGNSVERDPASASDENLRSGLLVKENSGCLPIPNALKKVSKRPCRPEFKDTNQNKRFNYVSGKMNETQQTTKVLLNENVDDVVVLPRRSSRLHSK